MTAMKPARSPIDRAFFALVMRGWDPARINNYEETLRKRDKALSGEVARTLASIDAKAAGLLTHTSMMIAGLGLIAPLVADNHVEVGIVIGEMAVYLLIGDRIYDVIHRELIIRSELYSLCIRAAIAFTIVVFVMLPVLYFWTEKPA
jgi:hypothetical protein